MKEGVWTTGSVCDRALDFAKAMKMYTHVFNDSFTCHGTCNAAKICYNTEEIKFCEI